MHPFIYVGIIWSCYVRAEPTNLFVASNKIELCMNGHNWLFLFWIFSELSPGLEFGVTAVGLFGIWTVISQCCVNSTIYIDKKKAHFFVSSGNELRCSHIPPNISRLGVQGVPRLPYHMISFESDMTSSHKNVVKKVGAENALGKNYYQFMITKLV